MSSDKQPTPIGNTLKAYVPPENWDKISDKEKIERMREIIKQNQRQTYQQISELQRKIDKLMEAEQQQKWLNF